MSLIGVSNKMVMIKVLKQCYLVYKTKLGLSILVVDNVPLNGLLIDTFNTNSVLDSDKIFLTRNFISQYEGKYFEVMK
jgi:hypothetical protein